MRSRRLGVVAWTLVLMLSLLLVSGESLLIVRAIMNQPLIVSCANAKLVSNQIAAENMCHGSSDWRLSSREQGSTDIEGFVAPASVTIGGTIRLFVTTTAPMYTFQIFRIGWYSGLGGRLMYTSAKEDGIKQPAPTIDPRTHTVRCDNWTAGPTVTIPGDWVSGMYIIKFRSSDGHSHYTPLVVRDSASKATIVFQASFLTYQAYNQWGGYSLYTGINPTTKSADYEHRAYIVSFDRPYLAHEGLGTFPESELNLVRWLERNSYSVTYVSDMDLHASPTLLHGRRLLIVGGHDEYWSTAMRQHAIAARDAGTSLAFFTANNVYWHVRIQPSSLGDNREVICYKDAKLDPVYHQQPLATTTRWRDSPLNDPEDGMLGEMYRGIVERGTSAPLVLAPGARPFLDGTGLAVGSVIPGVVGGEYDNASPTDLKAHPLIVLSISPMRCNSTTPCPPTGRSVSDATVYKMPNGAGVFNAGTFYWSWGLDDEQFDGQTLAHHALSSAGFQRFTANILAYLLTRK